MSDDVGKFCIRVHEKLATLQGRMNSLKLNIGTTWHQLQQKLDEARRGGAAKKLALAETRARLEQWMKENECESNGMIDQWIANHDTPKLTARAEKAEEFAWLAIVLAEASVDDVERMVLEAIAGRREAEAVTIV